MIQAGTRLKIADNSGAKIVECFKVLGGSRRRYAGVGDIIKASVKESEPRGAVKKKEVVNVVIVRQKKPIRRKNGISLRFDENAAVVLDGNEPKGTRIFGPIAQEIREAGFTKIVSLAEEIY